MKIFVLILTIIALVDAIPKTNKLRFQNLYKRPLKEIKSKPNPKIVAGQEAEANSIPFQAFLGVYDYQKGWYCSGTLISKNYVLSSAHCVHGGVEAFVVLGAHKPFHSEDTQISLLSEIITINANYVSGNITNDIAVIKLPLTVDLTEAIQIARLPTRADTSNSYVNVTARVSGWGATNGQSSETSEALNYADVKVIANSECEEAFGILPDSVICTSGEEGRGPCIGDTGAPLVTDGVQIGIVSFGSSNCETGYPSGYSRVTSFLDWISDNSDVNII